MVAGCASSFEFDPASERTGNVFEFNNRPFLAGSLPIEQEFLSGNILRQALAMGSFPLFAYRFANDLEDRIVDGDFEERRIAERMGPGNDENETEDLRFALGSSNVVDRRQALAQLRRGGAGSHHDAVLAALRDDDDQVRFLALQVLSGRWDPDDFDSLVGSLGDENPHNRIAAVREVEFFASEVAVPALREALFREKAPLVRVHLIRSLASRGDDARIFPALVQALGDEDRVVRHESIEALEALTGERFGFDAFGSVEVRARAQGRWRRWLETIRVSPDPPREDPSGSGAERRRDSHRAGRSPERRPMDLPRASG